MVIGLNKENDMRHFKYLSVSVADPDETLVCEVCGIACGRLLKSDKRRRVYSDIDGNVFCSRSCFIAFYVDKSELYRIEIK